MCWDSKMLDIGDSKMLDIGHSHVGTRQAMQVYTYM